MAESPEGAENKAPAEPQAATHAPAAAAQAEDGAPAPAAPAAAPLQMPVAQPGMVPPMPPGMMPQLAGAMLGIQIGQPQQQQNPVVTQQICTYLAHDSDNASPPSTQAALRTDLLPEAAIMPDRHAQRRVGRGLTPATPKVLSTPRMWLDSLVTMPTS
jgi:hypothetical protein